MLSEEGNPDGTLFPSKGGGNQAEDREKGWGNEQFRVFPCLKEAGPSADEGQMACRRKKCRLNVR